MKLDKQKTKNKRKKSLDPCIKIIIAIVALVGIFFVWFAIKCKQELDIVSKVQVKNIKSCVDGDIFNLGLGGIGTGYLESLDYYFYIQKDEGFVLSSLDVEHVEIVVDDAVEPFIEGHFNSHEDTISYIDVINGVGYKKDYCKYILHLPSDYKLEDFNILKIGVNNDNKNTQ